MRKKLTLLWSIASLGATPLQKLRLLFWCVYWFVAESRTWLPHPSARIRIRIEGVVRSVWLCGIGDVWVLNDVLVQREYDHGEAQPCETIIDLGSNVGISTLFLALRYTSAHVYAVEPNPQLRARLAYNLAGLANVSLHHLALAEHDGEAVLHIGSNSAHSSLFSVPNAATNVTVETVSPDSLLARLQLSQVDLVKFDIEGAERFIFSAAFKAFNRVRRYMGEMHYDLMPVTREAVQALTSDYERVEEPIPGRERSMIYLRRKSAILSA